MRVKTGLAVGMLALLALVSGCATLRDAWADEEASYQKYCAVPPNDAQLVSCSCMNPATPGCYPIPDDDGDNPSLMAKMIRRHARWHRQKDALK